MKITFVGCDETPEQYRGDIGRTINYGDGPVYAPGFRGMLAGIPGVLIDVEHWEIRPADMRTEEEKWLDEADELLNDYPVVPVPNAEIARRYLQAQRLILKAQARMTRRMR